MRIGTLIPTGMSLVLLFAAVRSDLRSWQIPNLWIGIGLTAGVFCRILSWSSFGWSGFFLGVLLPFLICWIPYRMGALGAGDVKLLMALGALSGGQTILYILFFSFLFAAGISLCRLLNLRQLRSSLLQLICFFQTMFFEGKIETYPGRYVEGHTIRFSIAILFGYTTWLGVSICRMLLL